MNIRISMSCEYKCKPLNNVEKTIDDSTYNQTFLTMNLLIKSLKK